MVIDHIALYVKDLEKMKLFYTKYFNATVSNKYHNTNTGLQTYFLSFDNGTRLEIMNRPDMEEVSKGRNQVGYIHLAFSLGSKGKVDELTNVLCEAGYQVISQPRTTGDGYYESCVLDPEGNIIEIVG